MRPLALMAWLLTLVLGAAACRPGASAGQRLTLVAYSTPREAYEELIPAFNQTTAGSGLTFEQSYGASGDQSRAVDTGLPGDVVAFSLEPDVTKLVESGRVDPTWNNNPYRGMVTTSVVVLVVRPGNPKQIHSWDDLVRPGIEVLTPNPMTSGGAQWNVMAAYGAQLRASSTHEQAVGYLQALFANVPVRDKSARESLQTFTAGKGDVMLAYENEAITAQQKGAQLEYVIPESTILIENPVAVVKVSKQRQPAAAFVDFLFTPEAQRIFAQKGYRAVQADVAAEFADSYPTPPGLFTIADLGGWPQVQAQFFQPETGVMAEIDRQLAGLR